MSHRLVIVVLVYNSADDARTCMDQLLAFGGDFRVIVVDNCSPDGSYETLREAYAGVRGVEVIQTGANRGYSAGNNFGIRYALRHYDFDTVAIMNPDVVIPQASVLDNLVDLLWANDDVLAVGGQPINHLEGDSPWPSGWDLPTDREVVLNHSILCNAQMRDSGREVAPGIFQVDCVVGCFFVAKAAEFAKLGLFDENVFLSNEENILGMKCRQAGLRQLVDKRQVYDHNHALGAVRKKPLKARLATMRSGYRSRLYFAETYCSTALRLPLWCVEKFNELVIVLGWLRRDAFRKKGGDK